MSTAHSANIDQATDDMCTVRPPTPPPSNHTRRVSGSSRWASPSQTPSHLSRVSRRRRRRRRRLHNVCERARPDLTHRLCVVTINALSFARARASHQWSSSLSYTIPPVNIAPLLALPLRHFDGCRQRRRHRRQWRPGELCSNE